jgi:hypothetical protein
VRVCEVALDVDCGLFRPEGTGSDGVAILVNPLLLLIAYPDFYEFVADGVGVGLPIEEGIVELLVVFLDDLEVVLLLCEGRVGVDGWQVQHLVGLHHWH